MGDRVSNGVEIGQEADMDQYRQAAAPPTPSPTPPPPPAMVYSNNNFMRRNVKVKEWKDFAIRDSEDDDNGLQQQASK